MHDHQMERIVLFKLEEISRKQDEILSRFTAVEYNLERLTKGALIMSQALDALTAQVTAQLTVEESAIALINGLGQQLAQVEAQLNAQGADTTALSALKQQLADSAGKLGAAITANTPAAPAPTPAPAPADATPAPVAPPAAATTPGS